VTSEVGQGRPQKSTPGVTLWFTGLPCSGKSTTSKIVERNLRQQGLKVEVLDGDIVRQHLTKGLGFTKEDRDENILRIGFVCQLLTRNGITAISAAISPYRDARERVRSLIGSFLEIYVCCPLDVCIERDVKGMYKQVMAGTLPHFTGISDPYEEPLNPDLTLETHKETPEQSAVRVLDKMIETGYLDRRSLWLNKSSLARGARR
jgi:adenylylsulfate kinase